MPKLGLSLTDREVLQECSVNNPAATLLARLFHVRRPQYREQPEYSSQAEALTILMQVAELGREEMAFRLCISTSMLDKATAGQPDGRFHANTLERAMSLATMCNLPVMARFFHILRVHSTHNIKRGSDKKQIAKNWWDEDKYTSKERER